MNILIATGIYPPEIGGPATFVPAIVQRWVAAGHTVRVVTYGDAQTRRTDTWPVEVVRRNGGPVVRYVRYFFRVLRAARTADVVFAQGGVSEGLPAMAAACVRNVPCVVRIPGDYAWEMSMQRSGGGELLDAFVRHRHSGVIRFYEWAERWVTGHARAVIVPSEYLKQIVGQWGVPESRISVVYNGIEPLPNSGLREETRRELGIGAERMMLTVVRAVPWKGGDFLIPLLNRLPADVHLAIAGDGPSLDEWKQIADSQGVSSRVRFLGRVTRTEVARWMRGADVFVLASGYEGFPHVVYEAVSIGLPCVVSNKGGNPETKKLFPEHVEVCALGDADAWKAGIERSLAKAIVSAPVPNFGNTAASCLALLQRVCGS